MGQLELECVNLDVRELIKEVNSLLSMQIEFRGLHYSCNVDESVPSEIWSDPNRIIQVVLNLVENAIKYNNPDGSIALMVKSLPEVGPDAIEISVADTGKGIDLERLNTLFSLEEIGNEKHYSKRVSVSLPIAFQICKKLGGELKVDTQVGLGSTFSFQIIPKRRPEHRSEDAVFSCEESEEAAEWDVEEDSSDERPLIHMPISSSRTKALGIHHTENHRTDGDSPIRRNSSSAHRRRKNAGESMELGLRRSPQFGGGHEAKRSIVLTDVTPDLLSDSMYKLKTNQQMIKEIMRMSVTPKRSFSTNDVLRGKTYSGHRHAHNYAKKLKQKIVRVKRFRAFLRQTVRRDASAIRTNIIRSKNDFFAPMSATNLLSKGLCGPSNHHVREQAPWKIRSVRNELLNFHYDHEMVRALGTPDMSATSISNAGCSTPVNDSRIEEERKAAANPSPQSAKPKDSRFVVKRGMCMAIVITWGIASHFDMGKEEAKEPAAKPTSESVLEKITLEIAKRFNDARCGAGSCPDILVVDDNEFNRFILVQILTKYGFSCGMVLPPPKNLYRQ